MNYKYEGNTLQGNLLLIFSLLDEFIREKIFIKYQNIRLHIKGFRLLNRSLIRSEMEYKEFKPRLKSAKTRFKLSAGLNLETFDTILSGTNHI